MPKIDFSKTEIYKISCKDPKITYVYVGSTTNFTKRKCIHKKNVMQKPNEELYSKINENGGWKNWEIKVLEKYNCNSRTEVIQREQEWIAKSCSQETKIISTINSDLQCKYCNKTLSKTSNLKRHEAKCKSKESYELKQKEELMKLQALQQSIVNNKNTTNNNNKNTMNNTIINNNIHTPVKIIPLGKENLIEFFSKDEQVKILKKMFGCFIYLVEYVHFSGKFPQFANIGITNLKSNIAYLYDETYNQFNAIEQSDVIPELISQRLQDIEQFLENVKGKLSEKEIQKIRQLIDEIEDQQQKYKNYAKNIKIMMYNNRSRMNMKHTPTQNTTIDYD